MYYSLDTGGDQLGLKVIMWDLKDPEGVAWKRLWMLAFNLPQMSVFIFSFLEC